MKAFVEVMKFDVSDVITTSVTCTNLQNGVNTDTKPKCEGCDGD